MSHIDSFKHQFVGKFGYLPVYLALEDIDGDFICSKHQLVLGGGSGEHPALVLANPDAAVARFIDNQIDHLDLTREEKNIWHQIYAGQIEWDNRKVLKFFLWGMKDYHDFHRMCTKGVLPNRFFDDEMSIEDWLVLGFGEFIFFAMPNLAEGIMSQLKEPYKYFHHTYFNNILLYPPNVPVYANGGNAFVSTLKLTT